jgi:hypothetical protein
MHRCVCCYIGIGTDPYWKDIAEACISLGLATAVEVSRFAFVAVLTACKACAASLAFIFKFYAFSFLQPPAFMLRVFPQNKRHPRDWGQAAMGRVRILLKAPDGTAAHSVIRTSAFCSRSGL